MEVGTLEQLDITEKMRSAYLDYAMSVITARALPDVRDGLKPVQRRILYAMDELGVRHDRPHRKSARIVGEVLGKYHPHGNDAVYETMVRMAQDFSMRYPLVDGQGNFGSVDGDNAAAMRYTEARMTAIAEEMLVDIGKETVDFVDNFDGSLQEPSVLPSRVPNLLMNGASGIAVGMATNIPPHNLGDLADAISYMIRNHAKWDDISVDDLLKYVPGPDFPTGGIILGTEGIKDAYATGKGKITVRSKVHTEDLRGGRVQIVITELPYQVNKAGLIERIANLVRNHRLEGISDLRDESDRQGMRVVIELKRGEDAQVNLDQLFKLTPMQTTFGVNLLALVDMTPRLLPLKQALQLFIQHRQEVVTRRTRYELAQAKARAHILEGLKIALDNLDEVISTIRRSRTAETARTNLMRKFSLSDIQARAILDLPLRRLAALERKKIEDEYKEVLAKIAYLEDLLADPEKILGLIRDDMREIKRLYADERRTHIVGGQPRALTADDLVPDDDVLLAVTQVGYVARLGLDSCSPGKSGSFAMDIGARDRLLGLAKANNKDNVLFFTNRGRVFQRDAHRIEQLTRRDKGQQLSSLVNLAEDERVTAFLAASSLDDGLFLTMATRNGRIKRLESSELAQIPNAGLDVIGLDDGDELRWAAITDGEREIVLVTDQGQAIRFQEGDVRPMGRSAAGVSSIKLASGDAVAGMDLARQGTHLLVVTEHGYAKRSPLAEYPLQKRYGGGVRTLDVSKLGDTGAIVGCRVVEDGELVVLVTSRSKSTCLSARDLPELPRASWSTLVRERRTAADLDEGDAMAMVAAYAMSGADAPAPSSSSPSRSRSRSTRSRRTRSTTSKSASTSGSRTRTTRSRAKPPADAGTTSAEAKAPTTRRRRSTTKTTEAKADAAPEAKPTTRRRRSTASKASSSSSGTTSKTNTRRRTTKATSTAEAAAPPESKPKATTRRRRAPKAVQPALPETTEVKAEGEAVTETKPTTRRRRTPPKPPEPAESSSTQTKTTSRRSRSTAAPSSGETSSTPTTPPATRSRGTRTRKSTSEGSEAKAEPDPAQADSGAQDAKVTTSSRTSKRREAAIEAARRVARQMASGSEPKSEDEKG